MTRLLFFTRLLNVRRLQAHIFLNIEFFKIDFNYRNETKKKTINANIKILNKKLCNATSKKEQFVNINQCNRSLNHKKCTCKVNENLNGTFKRATLRIFFSLSSSGFKLCEAVNGSINFEVLKFRRLFFSVAKNKSKLMVKKSKDTFDEVNTLKTKKIEHFK